MPELLGVYQCTTTMDHILDKVMVMEQINRIEKAKV